MTADHDTEKEQAQSMRELAIRLLFEADTGKQGGSSSAVGCDRERSKGSGEGRLVKLPSRRPLRVFHSRCFAIGRSTIENNVSGFSFTV